MASFKASDYTASKTISDLRIVVQDEPGETGAMFIHKKGECIMVLQREEMAALGAALDRARATSDKWWAEYGAREVEKEMAT
jgi:hypothetical protein